MTVEQLLSSMSSKEFTEWMLFDTMSPIGGLRGDVQAAVIAQAAVSPHVGKGKCPKLSDFMMFDDVNKTDNSVEHMMQQAEAFASRFKGNA